MDNLAPRSAAIFTHLFFFEPLEEFTKAERLLATTLIILAASVLFLKILYKGISSLDSDTTCVCWIGLAACRSAVSSKSENSNSPAGLVLLGMG